LNETGVDAPEATCGAGTSTTVARKSCHGTRVCPTLESTKVYVPRASSQTSMTMHSPVPVFSPGRHCVAAESTQIGDLPASRQPPGFPTTGVAAAPGPERWNRRYETGSIPTGTGREYAAYEYAARELMLSCLPDASAVTGASWST
jgi:hypothetical protein